MMPFLAKGTGVIALIHALSLYFGHERANRL
jgi:hypothetical protein